MPKAFYRRQLPHLQRDDKAHFITFCTDHRWALPEPARTIVLDSCLYDHGKKFDLIFAVVMPDHVHLILVPVINMQTREVYSLAGITDAIKGASAHKVNQALGRTGRVWQAESFDHVVRSSESLDQKIEYLRENPLRQGLARKWQGYRWIWQNPLVTSPR
ncbi:MAG: transposase [Terriglobales bacterium]|jgi:REP element-mobilizing transposase RayT